MKNLLKYFIGRTYQPLLIRYLSKTRTYGYKGIVLSIPKEVFHPGFFFSTKLLLRQVAKLPLIEKSLLELGAGSGLISIYAAREGAMVTATDINPTAIEYLERNSESNKASLQIIHSDLFDSIPIKSFDIIAINPPYYKKVPRTDADYAWFCGENGEYFERLFGRLSNFMHPHSQVYMTLCDGCDMSMIQSMANKNEIKMDCIYQKQNIIEKNYIFQLSSLS